MIIHCKIESDTGVSLTELILCLVKAGEQTSEQEKQGGPAGFPKWQRRGESVHRRARIGIQARQSPGKQLAEIACVMDARRLLALTHTLTHARAYNIISFSKFVNKQIDIFAGSSSWPGLSYTPDISILEAATWAVEHI